MFSDACCLRTALPEPRVATREALLHQTREYASHLNTNSVNHIPVFSVVRATAEVRGSFFCFVSPKVPTAKLICLSVYV